MELHRLGGLADRTLTRPRPQTATRARSSGAGFEQWTALCKPFQAAAVPRRCPFQHVIRRTPLKRRVHADSAVDTESLDSFRRRLQLRQLEDAVRLAQPPQTSGQHDTSPLDVNAASSPLPQTSNSSNDTPVPVTNAAIGAWQQTTNSSTDTAILDLNVASSHLRQTSNSSSASHHTSADVSPAYAANATTTSGLIDLPTSADIVTSERDDRTVAQQSTSESGTGAAPLTPPQNQQPHIPRPILILSCVSMGLTMASCVFNSLMPVYMVTELHMSMRSMGMLEGILEAFSYLVRMCSGIVSDLLANRKLTITAGFAMGAMAKFGLSFSTTVTQVFIGKAIDKLGNGVQAAPRDAMIGDLAPPQHRSSCFGFAQSLRKWGSTLGALSAYLLMRASDNNYQAIFLMAASLSAISTVAFTILVPASTTKQTAPQQQQQQQQPLTETVQQQPPPAEVVQPQQRQTAGQQWQALQANAKALGPKFFQFLLVVGLYGCGHIGESLLEARAVEVGFGKAEATLVVALLCFVVFLSAYPLGRLADKYGQRFTFSLGMASLIAGDLVLLTSSFFPPAVFIACVFWGMHWAVVQGPLLSIVVQLSPPHLRGTAFGIFYTVMAVTALAANTVFGYIWHTYSATAAFGLSAAIITATLIALPWLLPSEQQQEQQGGEQQLKLKLA